MLFRRFVLNEDSMNQYYEELMEEYANKSDGKLRRIQDISDICCGFPMTVNKGLSAFIFSTMLTYFAFRLVEIDLNVCFVLIILFMAILFAMILISTYISNSIKNKVASRILEEREKDK